MDCANSNLSSEYFAFIKSSKWKAIRTDLILSRGAFCENCGATHRLEVHHLTYKRFGGRERKSDLKILCNKCHRKIHNIKNIKSGIKSRCKRGGFRYYKNLAIRNLDINKKAKGWNGLAEAVAISMNEKSMFSNKDHAKRYAKDRLSKFEQRR